jgi:hypothetical protein
MGMDLGPAPGISPEDYAWMKAEKFDRDIHGSLTGDPRKDHPGPRLHKEPEGPDSISTMGILIVGAIIWWFAYMVYLLIRRFA